MMSYRHIEELDNAVRVARKAVVAARVDGEAQLTRFLYRRWYLGLTHDMSTEQPPLTRKTWQAWSRYSAPTPRGVGTDVVRLFLTCAPYTAPLVARAVTERAMSWREPWHFTCTTTPATPASAPEPCATVLYLPIGSLQALRTPVRELLDELRPLLGTGIPPLTLRIARGASLAQSPPGGQCFGEHRCSLVARAVLAGIDDQHRQQFTRTTETFARAGIDPERPYLESRPGDWDRFWRMY